MVLQLDVSALGASALGFCAVFLGRDASCNEKVEVDEAVGKVLAGKGRYQLGGDCLRQHAWRKTTGDKKWQRYSQKQRQKYIPRDFSFPRGVDFGIAVFGKEIENVIAGDEAIDLLLDGYPAPEPAFPDR